MNLGCVQNGLNPKAEVHGFPKLDTPFDRQLASDCAASSIASDRCHVAAEVPLPGFLPKVRQDWVGLRRDYFAGSVMQKAERSHGSKSNAYFGSLVTDVHKGRGDVSATASKPGVCENV